MVNINAFPQRVVSGDQYNEQGMTLRDYFAGQAIKHLISRKRDGEFSLSAKRSAEMSYEIADAMLKERDK